MRRLAIADPTVPKPRIPTRQRAGDRCRASPGLLPEVWNEFSGTMPEDTKALKSDARAFIYTSTSMDLVLGDLVIGNRMAELATPNGRLR